MASNALGARALGGTAGAGAAGSLAESARATIASRTAVSRGSMAGSWAYTIAAAAGASTAGSPQAEQNGPRESHWPRQRLAEGCPPPPGALAAADCRADRHSITTGDGREVVNELAPTGNTSSKAAAMAPGKEAAAGAATVPRAANCCSSTRMCARAAFKVVVSLGTFFLFAPGTVSAGGIGTTAEACPSSDKMAACTRPIQGYMD